MNRVLAAQERGTVVPALPQFHFSKEGEDMQNESLVSVIIPTYNRPQYLPEAVESVLNQTYPTTELIVVDDGSPDQGRATKEALKPYLSSLTYVYQENAGLGAAINKGLSLIKGKYIQRLDDDDTLEAEKIEKCVEVFEGDPAVGLVATGYYVTDESGNHLRTQIPISSPEGLQLLFSIMFCISAQAAVMVRSSVHDVVGLYREDIMSEDNEMWIRIARRFKVATIREPLISYRRHNENLTRAENQPRFERDILQYVKGYLEEIPLDELIPGVKSEAHGHALKAAVYLRRDAKYARGIRLARQELDRAFSLSPDDPLLFIWEIVWAIHKGAPFRVEGDTSGLGEFQELGKEICELGGNLQELRQSPPPPDSPRMASFRGRFARAKQKLIMETHRRALGR
jgi:glycosyltransferase involved in cell wall biosynthesis